MRVMSLFDGISCGRVAFERAGIPVSTYYASEIHKPSIQVAQKNYPDTIQLGDVCNVDGKKYKDIDILIGGSPCFRAGTLITTDRGFKKIEDIKKGDRVLTHKNRYREVVEPMVNFSNKIYDLKVQGSPSTHVTEEHPYYVRKAIKDSKGVIVDFTEPDWIEVKDLSRECFIGFIPEADKVTELKEQGAEFYSDNNFLWVQYEEKTLLDLSDTVYNFEVEEDNSYVANNCIVHNCQGFSFAGKQLNFEDPRSKLFFEFVRILKETKPKYFLLENVNMKKEYQDVISKYLGIEPIMINSNLVSAQNRKRLYWTNIPDLTQPRDKGILLKDIVHEFVDLDSVMSESWARWFKGKADYLLAKKYASLDPDKAITMTARQYANWNGNFVMECLNEYIVPFDKALQVLDKSVQSGKMGYFRKDSQANRVYFLNNKAVTLCGDAGGGAAKMGQYLFGEVKENYFQYDLHGKGHGSQDQRAYYLEGKHGTLPSRGASSKCKVLFGEITPDAIIPGEPIEGIVDGQKFYTLTNKENRGVLIEGYIRKLTPIEAERLQTLPDNYTEKGLDAQYLNLYTSIKKTNGGFKRCRSVKLKGAKTIFQAGQLDCATNIIFDLKEMEQLKLSDQLSIKVNDVQLTGAKETEKHPTSTVSCTISDSLDLGLLNCQLEKLKNANFAIDLLLQEGSVTSTIKIGRGMETQSIPIKLEQEQVYMGMRKHKEIIELSTEKLFQSYLGETYQKKTLSTILTLINVITMNLIYTCVKDSQNIHLSISNLTASPESLLKWDILNLRTENITLISNAQRYAALGNGWTVDVIAHILSHIK